MSKPTYDPASADLAEHFLQDEPFTKAADFADFIEHALRVEALAVAIQQAAEDWLELHPRIPDTVADIPWGTPR